MADRLHNYLTNLSHAILDACQILVATKSNIQKVFCHTTGNFDLLYDFNAKIIKFAVTMVDKNILMVDKFLSAFLCFLLSLTLHAGNLSSVYTSRFISVEDGLPSATINDMYMDGSGFLWLATNGEGLCRYDGNSSLLFSTSTRTSLRSNFPESICEDAFHRLWIASDNGLDIISLVDYSSSQHLVGLIADYVTKPCTHVERDSEGKIWLLLQDSIVMLEFDSKGDVFRKSELKSESVARNNLTLCDVLGDGSVYANIGGQISKVYFDSLFGLIYEPVDTELTLGPDSSVSDYYVSGSSVWIGTHNGLFNLNLSTGTWKEYWNTPGDQTSLTQNYISSISETHDGQMLVSTRSGLNVYDQVADNFERIRPTSEESGANMLSTRQLNKVRIYGGHIWIATNGAGLIKFDRKRLQVDNYTRNRPLSADAGPSAIGSIFFDSAQRPWFGTVGNGVLYKPSTTSDFVNINQSNSDIHSATISAVAEDGMRRIWFGTWVGGIDVVSIDNPHKVLFHIRNPRGRPMPLRSVNFLEYDKVNDRMWIGAVDGFYYYDIKAGELRDALPVRVTNCRGSLIDKNGCLWVGGNDGVYVIDLYSGEYTFLDNLVRVYTICQSSDGDVWIGCNGSGIYRVKMAGLNEWSMTKYTSVDGLASNLVLGILDDGSGHLWISTENGLSTLDIRSGRFETYSTADGLSTMQFYRNAYCNSPNGSLYFGHMEGLSVITPRPLASSMPVIKPSFTDLEHDGETLNIIYEDRILLSEADRTIRIGFSDLLYDTSRHYDRYYCLEGFDRGWIRLSDNDNSIRFTNLPAGTYRLRLKTEGKDGSLVGECSLAVKVIPRVFKRWWFILLAAALILLAVLHLFRLRTVALKERQVMLEKEVEKRTMELERQNRALAAQNEELARHKLLVSINPKGTDASGRQDNFVESVMSVIRSNYKNSNLDIATFCEALGISKSLLSKKFQESFGQPASQFIRSYRLSVAYEMIVNNRTTGNMNISEIAYEVGFNDPKYFTRCFTRQYNMTPSALLQGEEKKQADQ